ncbi:hypothetical protein GCM10010112_89090 [Actinoplanes lobatus]|uniref:DUF732 domain-containing protein n=1 Tax=Actinoplanes lobatus TaxID=113568 RepID=A0A7W7MLA1_9ACTN|nr:DUF732 domain-containing protein [Actinoplanes lobatus]MBB4753900.1 hypothetical protein [Actinoplanes lobatus]GGN97155.1 hypothetical protein GCM10010112_89090 [Actinoplanes lobatus]GIE45515.1 hypothetical protein Alo02nite_84130 [Actinoplanes lobatus]
MSNLADKPAGPLRRRSVVGRGGLGRAGLVVLAVVPFLSGCVGASPVPEWKDPQPIGATPSVTGPVAAVGSAGTGIGPTGPVAAPGSPGAVTGLAPVTDGGAQAVTGGEFLDAVRGELPAVAIDRRAEEITELGGQACSSLAAGNDRAEVAAELTEFGLETADARRLVTLARKNLCQS